MRDTCPGDIFSIIWERFLLIINVKGDSGSPLMQLGTKNLRWVLNGIVSLGLRECGAEGVPGVYTNVKEYLGMRLGSNSFST